MKSREQIEKDPRSFEALTVELLLDIRDLLQKPSASSKVGAKKRGRPRKTK